jgi:hypothetical protein
MHSPMHMHTQMQACKTTCSSSHPWHPPPPSPSTECAHTYFPIALSPRPSLQTDTDGKPVRKRDAMRIMRTIGRSAPVEYHVTDKEPTKKEDWARVVGVICLGKAWQFKKWPFKVGGGACAVHMLCRPS